MPKLNDKILVATVVNIIYLLLCKFDKVVVIAEKNKIIGMSDSRKLTIVDNNNNRSNISGSGNNKKTLVVKSIPGYPGIRSDVYEIYMEPYNFVSIHNKNNILNKEIY